MYPHAAEIRGLTRRYGPELANSVSRLIEENKSLRLKLQSSIRAQARLKGTVSDLGDALREHEERSYARQLADAESNDAEAGATKPTESHHIVSALPARGSGISPSQSRAPTGDSFVRRYCECSEKLQELLDCIDTQVEDYERGVWQMQVNVLEEERDSLMLK